MATKKSGGGSSLVAFGDFDEEEAAAQSKESEASRGTSILMKLKPGKTTVRAIPPKQGEKLMKVAYVHYVDIPGVGRKSFNCPRQMAKQRCPVCDMENKLIATGNDADYNKAKKLHAKRRLYMNVIVRGREEDGIKVLPFGTMIEDQLIEIRRDEEDGGNFSHPIKGFDLKISRKGEGQNDTEYKVSKTGDVKPLHEEAAQMNEWIGNQPSLDRFLRVLPLNKIEALLRGEDINEDDDEEDARPRKQTKKPSKSMDEEIEDGITVDDEDED